MKKSVKKESLEKIKFLNKIKFNKNNLIYYLFFIILLLIMGLILFSNYQKDTKEFIGKRIGKLYSGLGGIYGCPVGYEVNDDGYCTNDELAECGLTVVCQSAQGTTRDGETITYIESCKVSDGSGEIISTCTEEDGYEGFSEDECTHAEVLESVCEDNEDDEEENGEESDGTPCGDSYCNSDQQCTLLSSSNTYICTTTESCENGLNYCYTDESSNEDICCSNDQICINGLGCYENNEGTI